MLTLDEVVAAAQGSSFVAGVYSEYAEPGYKNPKTIIVLGNWNKDEAVISDGDKFITLGDAVEQLGGETEWSDEWAPCHCCGKLVRTEPDGHWWKPSYYLGRRGRICVECVKADPEDYVSEHVGEERFLTIPVDLAGMGYRVYKDKLESGQHEGMNADPYAVKMEVQAAGFTDFVFVRDEQSQFYTVWSVWVREEQNDD